MTQEAPHSTELYRKYSFPERSENYTENYLSCLKHTIPVLRVSSFELLWESLRLLLRYTFNK